MLPRTSTQKSKGDALAHISAHLAALRQQAPETYFADFRPPRTLTLKIKRTQIIATCPGRNFMTAKVFTDEGLYGWGEATHAVDFGSATGSAS